MLLLASLLSSSAEARAEIPPCQDTAFRALRDQAGFDHYLLPSATFNWTFHNNPWTTPPYLVASVTDQALVAGAGGWNEKRTSDPACDPYGPSWTRWLQGVSTSGTPGAFDSWNQVGFQNFTVPLPSTDPTCRSLLTRVNINGLGLTCSWGSDGFGRGTIFQTDIILNAQRADWTTLYPGSPTNQFIVQAVATHEFGHAIGLAHVDVSRPDGCSRDNDHIALTMYPYSCKDDGAINTWPVTLGNGDIRGLVSVPH